MDIYRTLQLTRLRLYWLLYTEVSQNYWLTNTLTNIISVVFLVSDHGECCSRCCCLQLVCQETEFHGKGGLAVIGNTAASTVACITGLSHNHADHHQFSRI